MTKLVVVSSQSLAWMAMRAGQRRSARVRMAGVLGLSVLWMSACMMRKEAGAPSEGEAMPSVAPVAQWPADSEHSKRESSELGAAAEAQPQEGARPDAEPVAAMDDAKAAAPETATAQSKPGKTSPASPHMGSGAGVPRGETGAVAGGSAGRMQHSRSAIEVRKRDGASKDQLQLATGELEQKQNSDASGENYAYVPENDFVNVSDDPLSTFSIDVDTASFANVRRFIRAGQLPPVDAVRIEEFINYFRYTARENDVRLSPSRPVHIDTEVGPTPWSPEHRLVRLTMHSFTPQLENIPPRNLVFLIDVSGSMMDSDKLPLLKQAFSLLTAQLRAQDYVSLVVYAGASGVVLPPTSGSQQDLILGALERLQAGGSTNGGEGIELAYRLAKEHYRADAVNRVILATDGDFNVGTTSQGDLVRMIERKREEGVELSVLGFGSGNLKDHTMEQLADKGNGNYAYIDSLHEARKVLVQEAGATLMTIAKDVKLQVEFNPSKVASYRLIGYENRRLAHTDFNDDRKDAGEVGAGHTVTALYEIAPTSENGVRAAVDPLRYQEARPVRPNASSDEIMHVKVRFKAPKGASSEMLSFPVVDHGQGMERATQDFRFAAAVASYGMILRQSKYRGATSLRDVEAWASQGMGVDEHGHRRDFVELVRQTQRLQPSR